MSPGKVGSEWERGSLALGLVDQSPGEGRLLGTNGVGLLGKVRGQLRVGIEGSLDAARDRACGAAELYASGKRGREPRAKNQWQAIGLGHEWGHGADRAGDGAAGSARWVGVVLGRGLDGVIGGGELVVNDGELGSPAGSEIGRGLWIFQGLAQGMFAGGQGIAQHAKILAR